MEMTRVLLIGALFLLGFMLWNAWQNDYPPPVATTMGTPPTAKATVGSPSPSVPPIASSVLQPNLPATTPVSKQYIHVKTDVLDLMIDPLGGNIVQTSLLKYPQQLHSSIPYQLFNNDPATLYAAQSGLISTQGPDNIQGQAMFTAAQQSYVLNAGQDEIKVDLHWQGKNGINVTKEYVFHRDAYLIQMNYRIDNQAAQPWIGQLYTQLERKKPAPPPRGFFSMNPYSGGAISSPDNHYQKISFAKMDEQNLNLPIVGGWAAMLEHYFLSAWIPVANQTSTYYSNVNNGNYVLGTLGSPITVQPGSQYVTTSKLYVGPEEIDRLKTAAPNLDLTIDFGMLWFIAIPILWLLKQIYLIVGNWGWAIVLVTIIIKLLFYHLSAKSYRSMAGMRKLQPKIQALRERYADDKQKLSQATMELYKTEKINPLGGCLPVLVQIPVFIALYWVLFESVELRQAPFILWIQDLSMKDPYYILPVIMGITMFIQQKLNPPPPDPTQAKMMQFLPIFFTFIFLSFPAGLVLYWIVNNALSILQQWYITRSVETADVMKNKKA